MVSIVFSGVFGCLLTLPSDSEVSLTMYHALSIVSYITIIFNYETIYFKVEPPLSRHSRNDKCGCTQAVTL